MKLVYLGLFLLDLLCIKTSLASEQDTYNFSWLDPDKEVYVLQNRKFRKKGNLHFSLNGGKTLSGPFVNSTSFQGRAGYFASEELGFEFVYSKNSGEENLTAQSVRQQQDGTGSIPFRRIVDNYIGGMIQWAPFYSKINTFNKIFYYDWIFGLGIAKLEETNNRQELDGVFSPVETTENHTGLLWNLGIRLYITPSWSFRVDVTTVHFKARRAMQTASEGDETMYSNFDLVGGLNFTF